MIIRAAVPADAEALVALTREIVAEPVRTAPLDLDEVLTVEESRAQLAGGGIRLVAVSTAGELLGTISLRRASPRRALAHTAVLGMSVRAASRGQGIGRALLEAALAAAAPAGLTRIELYVFARNAAAIALYEKLGFAHEGRRRRAVHLDGEHLDDLIMAKLV